MSVSVLSSGKTKTVTPAGRPDQVILTFRDDITAGDGKKHDLLPGKGKVNAAITAKLYTLFTQNQIPNHLIKQIDDNNLLVTKLEMIPVEVVCRIRAAGHFIGIGTRYKNGDKLAFPIVEFYLKDDSMHDPMLTDQHLKLLQLASDFNGIRIRPAVAYAGCETGSGAVNKLNPSRPHDDVIRRS